LDRTDCTPASLRSPQAARRLNVVSSVDSEGPQSSRTRLLNAGKTLFARNGYEQTSTAAIARSAGSSESQLIRYFGGKAGLLEAIFDDSWADLFDHLHQAVEDAAHGRDAIVRTLSVIIDALNRDHDIAFLFLFEGRRTRGSSREVVLSSGYRGVLQIIDKQIDRGRADGSFRTDIAGKAICSAILGAAEGLLRDRVLAARKGEPQPFDDAELMTAFRAMVDGLAPA
jgi:AcrR family transcriptional regulator